MSALTVRSALIGLRGAAAYAAAWSPLVLVYLVAIGTQEPISLFGALVAALRSVTVAALLGLAVAWLARREPWPDRFTIRFVAIHLLGAACYGALWTTAVMLWLYRWLRDWDAVAAEAARWGGWQLFYGFLLYWVVAGVTWARSAAARARRQELAYLEADALRVRAELSALRGQLDPHFLFNTLHTAAVLTKHDPAAAALALERLAGLLRYVLDAQRGARDEVPLADELGFIDAYLALEGLRLGERLRVERDIAPDALDKPVPSLALQPLVENALRYGIAERASGGTLSLRGRLEDRTLVLEVADDGPGTSRLDPPRGTGVGLTTLRERLRARFGAAAKMEIETAPGRGFHVTLRIPA
jgi:signal transduction histidine kinase